MQRDHLTALGWTLTDDPAAADVIACHAAVPDTYLNLYPRKPLVIHNHGAYWTPEYEWQDWAYRSNKEGMEAIRAADVVTAVSEWTAAILRRHSARDVRVVTHGVDTDEWAPLPPADRASTTPYVLWNKTRVDPICDPTPVNSAAALLPDVRFVSTFGDPASNVTLIGRQPYATSRDYVRHAAVYLCTTRETYGVGTLEALASGVPVVGYDWGGQSEIITHGVDGWLVRPGDISGLADGIRWALDNRTALADVCRATALRHTPQMAAVQYAAIYAEVLARRTTPHPRVSVIVPAYNLAHTLPDTLRSVQAQTATDWECIVVDDASPDACGDIAEQFAAADPRIRVIHNATNQYLAESRNIGMAAARGDYLLPLDADDMIAPNTLQILADALDTDRRTDIAYGGVLFVDADGVTPHNYGHITGPGHSGWPIPFDLEIQLNGPGQVLPVCSLMRRSVWAQTGGYRRRARSSEDCDLWLRAVSYGFIPRMITTADTLIYRLRPDSMSATQGWQEHRAWYPWVKDRALIPAGAGTTRSVPASTVPYPAYDPPAISVIIPCGPGHAPYVQDAVDSVAAQTLGQWECIVINDSGAPITGLPAWVKVVTRTDASDVMTTPQDALDIVPGRFNGVAAARNAGITLARGALFLPLDADDYLTDPQALQVLLEAHLDSGKCRAVVYPDWWENTISDPGTMTIYEADDYDVSYVDGRARTHKGVRRMGAIYSVVALIPRTYWVQVGGYDETLPCWEDWAFSIALAAHGVCQRRVSVPMFLYRKQTGARRDANYDAFDAGKDALMHKDWGLGEGGIVACSTCGGKSGTYGSQQGVTPPADGAVLMEYTGGKGGSVGYRGAVTKQVYRVSSLSPQFYAYEPDIPALLMRGDFKRVDTTALPVNGDRPVLVAERTVASPVMDTPAPQPIALTPAPVVMSAAAAPAAAPPAPDFRPPASAVDDAPPVTADPDAVDPPDTSGAPISAEAQRVLNKYRNRAKLEEAAKQIGIDDTTKFKTNAQLAQVIAVMMEMNGVPA